MYSNLKNYRRKCISVVLNRNKIVEPQVCRVGLFSSAFSSENGKEIDKQFWARENVKPRGSQHKLENYFLVNNDKN